MENIVDLIAKDHSPSEVSDLIKDVLYGKASEKIDALRPKVGSAMFDEPEVEETEQWLLKQKVLL